MYGFYVSLSGVTASFREPGAHLYQSTLPLPPVSALVGILGAASGRNFAEAWCFAKSKKLAVGVSGESGGTGIDLWKYRKIATPKSPEEKETSKALGRVKIVRSDILNREFLAYPRFTVFYAFPDKNVAEDLHGAFRDPVYALSLGSSDELARIDKVSDVREVEDAKGIYSFENTILEGDYADDIRFDWDAIRRGSVSRTLKAPLVRQLIVDFSFDGDARHGCRYRPFTFLLGLQRLEQPQRAFVFGDRTVPLYALAEA